MNDPHSISEKGDPPRLADTISDNGWLCFLTPQIHFLDGVWLMVERTLSALVRQQVQGCAYLMFRVIDFAMLRSTIIRSLLMGYQNEQMRQPARFSRREPASSGPG